MKSKTLLVFLLAVLAGAMLVVPVSAFGSITSVKVDGLEALNSVVGTFAGSSVPVEVTFKATRDANDTRIKVWIAGEKENIISTERFDVLAGEAIRKVFSVRMPSNIDPQEKISLAVSLESRNGIADQKTVTLSEKREAYAVELLDVNMDGKVAAGETLFADVVLKNRGRRDAEDAFVRASIPALGIEQRAYFGDLSPLDRSDPDRNDALERRLLLRIPANTKAGTYAVIFDAYTSDATATITEKVNVVASSEETTLVVSPQNSKTFGAGEKATYSLTLVNSGNKVHVYGLALENTAADLSVTLEESVVAIPSGSSKTIKLEASSAKTGTYLFAVNVNAEGTLVKKENFTANVEGKGTTVVAGNTTLLITIVLAIIFVVLLVVLIVLLTRKPEKTREFGESYY